MGQKSSIEWTDATWNPIRGCTRVSEGCRHCYAETVANRFSGPGLPYEGLTVLGEFVEEHLLDPLRWKAPRRIFVNSMSDLFHPGVTDAMLDKIFAVMALCPQHAFQILTKRPERMVEYGSNPARRHIANSLLILAEAGEIAMEAASKAVIDAVGHWPLRNVWLGVSVEDQGTARGRIWPLLKMPAAVRFISYEPALGAVDLDAIEVLCKTWRRGATIGTYLDWVICGGESGPGARPMQPEWAQLVRDQCIAAGVAFFFKQWGEWLPFTQREAGQISDSVSFDLAVRADGDGAWRTGKKAAGNRLDGKVWQQFPGKTLMEESQ
jgi:protein gp37